MKKHAFFLVGLVLVVLMVSFIYSGIVPLTSYSLAGYAIAIVFFYGASLYSITNHLVDSGQKVVLLSVVAFFGASFVLAGLFAMGWALFGWFGPSTYDPCFVRTGIDAFYFSVITLTSVGFGDLVPYTGPAKLFASLEALMGSSHMVAFFSVLLLRVKDPAPAPAGSRT